MSWGPGLPGERMGRMAFALGLFAVSCPPRSRRDPTVAEVSRQQYRSRSIAVPGAFAA